MKNRIVALLLGTALAMSNPLLVTAAKNTDATATALLMDEEQLRAITILNYLTMMSEEINSSKNSRLFWIMLTKN